MDIVRMRIPYGFVRDIVSLTWHEVRFGLVNDLLDPAVPVELAVDQIAKLAEPHGALLELASIGKNEPTLNFVEQLAEGEPQRSEKELKEKWLYIVLAWIYEHRNQDPDPLQKVEEVYADFNYPEQIAKFVRYMPLCGPDLGSREQNEQRLFERWRQYLDDMASVFAPHL